MSKPTLGNLLLPQATTAISNSVEKAKEYGDSIATGIDSSVDPVIRFSGNDLMHTAKILNSIHKKSGYYKNTFKAALNYLEKIRKAITEAQATNASADNASPAQLAILNNSFMQQINQVKMLTKQCIFGNKSLLTGGFSNSDIQTSVNNYGHSVIYSKARGKNNYFADGGGGLLNDGAKSTYTITFNNANAAPHTGAMNGDILQLTDNNVSFTFCDRPNYTGAPGQVLIGNVAETTKNFGIAFNKYAEKVPELQDFTVDINPAANNQLILTSRNDGVRNPFIYNPATGLNPIGVVPNAPVSGALELNTTTAEKLIGKKDFQIRIAASAITVGGGNQARALIQNNNKAHLIDSRNAAVNRLPNANPAANGDVGLIFEATLAGEVYDAAVFIANASNLNDYYIKFCSRLTNSTFTIKTAAAPGMGGGPNPVTDLKEPVGGGGGGLAVNLAANEITLRDNIRTLMTDHIEILQTRRLDLDRDIKGVLPRDSFVEGLAINLTHNDFAEKKFESFEIIEDINNAGRYHIRAKISGEQYQTQNSLPANDLISNKLITLNSLLNPDHHILTINVGNRDWTDIGNNIKKISKQVSWACNIGKELKICMGIGPDATINANIGNLSPKKLFVDNNNQHVIDENLNINSHPSRLKAEQVLQNALAKINQEIANIEVIKSSITNSAQALKELITINKETSRDMVSTNYLEASELLSEQIRQATAVGAALVQLRKIAEMTLEMIKNA